MSDKKDELTDKGLKKLSLNAVATSQIFPFGFSKKELVDTLEYIKNKPFKFSERTSVSVSEDGELLIAEINKTEKSEE